MELVTITNDENGLVHYSVRPPGRPDIAYIEGTADTLDHAIEIVTIVLAELLPIK